MSITVGIDIGGTNTKIGLVSSEGKLLGFTTFPTTEPSNFLLFTKRVRETVDALLKTGHISYGELIGVGVGAPDGNSKNGFIENPPNLKMWGTVDLVTPFKEAFGIPVKLENDANVAALGEGLWGCTKNMRDYIVVTLGTGIGTGIIVNGHLVRGVNGLAGEGGHLIIEPNGRECSCGGFGHLEIYGSVRGIKITAKEITGEDLRFRDISNRFSHNDPEMEEVFLKTAQYLGRGLAVMGSLFAPEAIVLAGGVATVGEKFRINVEKYYNEFVYHPFKGATKILVSTISTTEGAVLGAASLICK